MKQTFRIIAFVVGICCGTGASADTLLVAVATNFAGTLEELGTAFFDATGHDLQITSASSGVHYAQITNGAPFDLFFSADVERPRLLEEQSRIVAGSRFTYAVGRLALWSADANRVDGEGAVLRTGNYARLAVADAEAAPYGLAAQQVLEKLGLTAAVQDKLITGTNIGQTFQFVASRAVPLGFIAYSQLRNPEANFGGSHWLVPSEMHDPIEQQAVILKDSSAAQQFVKFLTTQTARAIVENYGYSVP